MLSSSLLLIVSRRTFLIVSPQSPQTNQGIAIFDSRGERQSEENSAKEVLMFFCKSGVVETKKWPCCSFFPFSFSLFDRNNERRKNYPHLFLYTPKKPIQPAMVLLPNVKWAQRKDKLFLTIDIQVRAEKKCDRRR